MPTISESLYFRKELHELVQDQGCILSEVTIYCPLCKETMDIKTPFILDELNDSGKLRLMISHGHECSEFKPRKPAKSSTTSSKSRLWVDISDIPL